MPLSYHIAGWVSVFFFTLALVGVLHQLQEIWNRKNNLVGSPAEYDRPTAVLSLNQFFASFLAFYSFLVYGICSTPLNHYLVWTRLVATVIVLLILREIWLDRGTRLSLVPFVAALLLMFAAIGLLSVGHRFDIAGRAISSSLAVFAAAVFAQGLIHQIIRVRQTGRTGAISLRMHQLTTYKDASSILFALTMPIELGWPLMVVGGVGVGTKSVLMWHFRWARLSPAAEERRSKPIDVNES